MHRDVLRRKRQHPLQRLRKPCRRIQRQPCDEVHIDVPVAQPPRLCKAVQNILRSMPAANGRQHLVR